MEIYIVLITLVVMAVTIIALMYMISDIKRSNVGTVREIEKVSESQYREINEFKTLINNEISEMNQKMSNDLLYMNNHISDSINGLNQQTADRLNRIERSVSSSLLSSYDKTEKLMISVGEKMSMISETQNNLKEISKDITSLENILSDKKSRGIFGEVELYSILDNIYGGDEHFYKRQVKLSNGTIVDALIMADKPLGNIAVDSKFPLESFNCIFSEESDKKEKERATLQFKKDVIKHINDISSKYLIENETSEIAFMFVPSESIYARIYGDYGDVVEYSYRKHVYIVSPTTLHAYLTAIRSIYINVRRDENISLMKDEFAKLSIEFKRYEERFIKLYNDYEKLSNDFRDLSITGNKIINRFHTIQNVDIGSGGEINEREV